MVVYERKGDYIPSLLQDQLLEAGIAVYGVTCSEDDNGAVTAVQIICDDDVDEAALDAALSSYAIPVEKAIQIKASAVSSLDPATATTADVVRALQADETA